MTMMMMMTYCWLQYVYYRNFLYVTSTTFSIWDFQVVQMTEGLLYFKHILTEQAQVSCHYIVKL